MEYSFTARSTLSKQHVEFFSLFSVYAFLFCPDSKFEGFSAWTGLIAERLVRIEEGFYEFDGIHCCGGYVVDDFFEQSEPAFCYIMFFPAVIVAGQRYERIAHLGLTGKFGFGQSGHSNEISTPAFMH